MLRKPSKFDDQLTELLDFIIVIGLLLLGLVTIRRYSLLFYYELIQSEAFIAYTNVPFCIPYEPILEIEAKPITINDEITGVIEFQFWLAEYFNMNVYKSIRINFDKYSTCENFMWRLLSWAYCAQYNFKHKYLWEILFTSNPLLRGFYWSVFLLVYVRTCTALYGYVLRWYRLVEKKASFETYIKTFFPRRVLIWVRKWRYLQRKRHRS